MESIEQGIVREIIEDLTSRSGLGWDGVDEATKARDPRGDARDRRAWLRARGLRIRAEQPVSAQPYSRADRKRMDGGRVPRCILGVDRARSPYAISISRYQTAIPQRSGFGYVVAFHGRLYPIKPQRTTRDETASSPIADILAEIERMRAVGSGDFAIDADGNIVTASSSVAVLTGPVPIPAGAAFVLLAAGGDFTLDEVDADCRPVPAGREIAIRRVAGWDVPPSLVTIVGGSLSILEFTGPGQSATLRMTATGWRVVEITRAGVGAIDLTPERGRATLEAP